jgi:16S rRNA (uracil1498-N3)-methyltransferase
MKIHRFFVGSGTISGNKAAITDTELLSQLKKVLRVGSGDFLILLDGSGKEYLVKAENISGDALTGSVEKISQNQNEPELKITLYQAICKKDKFELVLQKGTEVGVSEFIQIITERTEKLGINRERLEKVLKEAAEQSERGIIPSLGEVQKFEDALLRQPADQDKQKIILDRSGKLIKAYLLAGLPPRVSLFVGPEGGFTEKELEIAKNSGAKIASLGKTVLRTETAGLAAAVVLLNK